MALKFEQPNIPARKNSQEQFMDVLQGIPSLMMQYQNLQRQKEIDRLNHELQKAELEGRLFSIKKQYGTGEPAPMTQIPQDLPAELGGEGISSGLPTKAFSQPTPIQETDEQQLNRLGLEGYKALNPAQYVAIGAGGQQVLLPPGTKPFSQPGERPTTTIPKSEFLKNPDAYINAPGLKVVDDTLSNTSGGGKSKYWDSVDVQAGKEYADFSASGGAQKVISNVSGLEESINDLMDKKVKTGPLRGSLPGQEYFNPRYAQLRDRVYNIIFPNLRMTLGAQFTENEGKRVLAATLNPKMSPEDNAERLTTLMEMIKAQAVSKQAAGDYANQFGTLRGFKNDAPTNFNEFEAELKSRLSGTPNKVNATKIKSDAEYDALPSGTEFVGPDGVKRRKP